MKFLYQWWQHFNSNCNERLPFNAPLFLMHIWKSGKRLWGVFRGYDRVLDWLRSTWLPSAMKSDTENQKCLYCYFLIHIHVACVDTEHRSHTSSIKMNAACVGNTREKFSKCVGGMENWTSTAPWRLGTSICWARSCAVMKSAKTATNWISWCDCFVS